VNILYDLINGKIIIYFVGYCTCYYCCSKTILRHMIQLKSYKFKQNIQQCNWQRYIKHYMF